MSKEHLKHQIDEVRERVRGFRDLQIYMTFARLDLGRALEHQPLTLRNLAKVVDAEESGLGRFMDAAEAFDLIAQDDGRYRLSDLGFAMFAPSSDQSIVHALKLEAAFYERWGRLESAVRTGKRPEENRAQEDHPGWVSTFTRALYENSRAATRAIATTLAQELHASDSSVRMLDLGGGHGGYSIELARLRSDVRATVFDKPEVIETTRQIVEESGLDDRVTALPGDFHIDPIGSHYHVVLLFGVLHDETSNGAIRLLKTIRKALAPDGELIIRTHERRDATRIPGEREIFDLHMLLSTEGGTVRRSADTVSLVESNGFHLRTSIPTAEPDAGSLLVFSRTQDLSASR
jgi:2-polyprenyl-3-methyl-5-hydroxy-6-metoxy-1,4-benzoquinol methylase